MCKQAHCMFNRTNVMRLNYPKVLGEEEEMKSLTSNSLIQIDAWFHAVTQNEHTTLWVIRSL